MAGGAAVAAAGRRQDYPGGLTPFVLMACLVAATGGLIFGYDIGTNPTAVGSTLLNSKVMACIKGCAYYVITLVLYYDL